MAKEVRVGLKSAFVISRHLRLCLESLPKSARMLGSDEIEGTTTVAGDTSTCHLEDTCRRLWGTSARVDPAKLAKILEDALSAMLNG
jgi:hypothetical protein